MFVTVGHLYISLIFVFNAVAYLGTADCSTMVGSKYQSRVDIRHLPGKDLTMTVKCCIAWAL